MEKTKTRNARLFLDEDDYDFIMHIKEATGLSLQSFITKAIKSEILNIRSKAAVDQIPYMDKDQKKEIVNEAKAQIKNQKLC